MITALRATSRTVADYLRDQFVADPVLRALFAAPGTLGVYLNAPPDMTGSRGGLSVWLYRVERDESTLNHPPERVTPTLTRHRPLPVRLHYLLTPVTGGTEDDAPETEQAILGKVLQCFHDHPQLGGTDLRDDLAGTAGTVTLRLESLSVDELARVWDALESPYRTSLSYEASVVEVHSGEQPVAGPPVRVPRPEVGVVVGGEPGP